ncbi:hypothetical protein [Kribbella soli]|uniref:Uncharacterized protein n=1 Tax=Kribbella soli TaxID=1124743 RepID=A0A4R0GXL3_9ACTN|nr:hypothetical protein [Kribbella soli]TCC02717.1 hypothetical protein E0H45_37460 [Kribbella soli]
MESESSEPLEPDRIITPDEQTTDPREGVADARGAVRRRPRAWRGRGGRGKPPSSERQNEGRRR